MSKIGFIGDVHFGINEVSDEFIQYQIDSLKWAYEELKSKGATTIIFLGDFLDKRKYISLKIFQIVNDMCMDEDIEKIFLCGNHESFYKNTNEVNSIDLVLGTKDYKTVSMLPEEITIGDTTVLIIPWLNKMNLQESLSIIERSSAKYAFGHLELGSFELLRGVTCEKGQIGLNDLAHFEWVISGHFHCSSERGNIIYLGSLPQLTWADYGETKRVGVLDTESGEIEYMYNPYTMFEKIYIDDDFDYPPVDQFKCKRIKVYLNRKRTVKIERYINSIIDVALDVNVIDNSIVMNHVDMEIDSGKMTVTEIWDEYLKSVEEIDDASKVEIGRLFKKTYIEVQTQQEEMHEI